MKKNDERIKTIDVLRSFAISGVILCHATEGIYSLNLENILPIRLSSKIFAFSAFTLGRLGVPLFLMISGYLLLSRKYNQDRTIKFWKNNWFHLFVCTEIWFIIYDIFQTTYMQHTIGIIQVIKDLAFIHKINFSHVWYMPMILGMYILIPFVANALQNYSTKILIFPLLFFSIFSFGYPVIKVISTILGDNALSLQMSMGFSGGYYGIYFILGYLLRKNALKKLQTKLLLILAIIFFAAGVSFQIWAYSNNYQYNIWYDSPFILITSVATFELFSRIRYIPVYAAFNFLSYYSFAIYLIHNIIRSMIRKWIFNMPYIKPIRVALLWILCMSLSILCAWIIHKIPKIGKFILYTK